MRRIVFLLAVSIAASIGLLAPWAGPSNSGFRAVPGTDHGIWVKRTWIEERHTLAENKRFLETLRARGFRSVYLHNTPTDRTGALPPADPVQAARMRRAAREIEAETGQPIDLLAWVGGRADGGTVDLRDTVQRDAFAAACGRLVHELGFDGIHLNIEPLPTADEALREWLAAIRSEIGPDAVLSLAATRPNLLGVWDLGPIPSWGPRDYARASGWVDELAIMGYDSGLRSEDLYADWIRRSARWIYEAVRDGPNPRCRLLVGLPTYEEHRPTFDPETENLAAGLRGLRASGAPAPRAAVYAEWTTDGDEWATWEAAGMP